MLPRQPYPRSGAWYAVTHPGYALPIPGVNHVRISGDDRYGYCCGRLAQWQRAALAVPARAGWIAVPAHHTHVAQFGVRQPCCRASRTHDPARGTPLPILAMHYPQLVSTTCVSAGMIAMGTVVDDWHSGNALLQPCRHVLDGVPYPLIIRMSRSLECGSHAAAPAVPTIRRVAYRYPSWLCITHTWCQPRAYQRG